jgi:hypothetical protein
VTQIRRTSITRPLLIVVALVLAAAAAVAAFAPGDAPVTHAPASIADRLGVRTWALALPTSWLAAPIPGLRSEDILDLLGTRTGERATATEVATGLRVVSADDRALIVELTEDDASAIASARARGITLVPILRSSR